jgi:hypothetical protein
MKRLVLAFVVLIAASSCSKPGASPRATAEAFLDAHYVQINLERSKSLTTGLAHDKVEKEISLIGDNEITGETRKPSISYKLHRADEDDAAAQYAYELTVRPPGLDPFVKLVMVTVRNGEGGWSVTNYNESDMPGAN